MEGLYLRTEGKGFVTSRAKFVRPEFVEKIKQSNHWKHQSMASYIEELENQLILQALERTGNNKNQAARLLGLNRTTLVERIKKRKLVPLNSPSREL